jgi:hypothetical protein
MKFLLLTLCLLFTSCVTVLDCPPGVEYGDECTTHWVPARPGSGTPAGISIQLLTYSLKRYGAAKMEEDRLAAEKAKAQQCDDATNFITVNKE